MLGKNGFIGSLLFKYFDTQLIFTWWSGVIAVSVVILPVVYQSVKTGFISLDKVYLEASRELGLTKMQTLIHVQLPLIKKNIASAMLLGFGRGIGEFGATVIVAGNLPGRTQTIPMAIYTAIEQGDNSSANMLLVTTIIISVIVILLYNFTIREEE